jgi:hypothetical protein
MKVGNFQPIILGILTLIFTFCENQYAGLSTAQGYAYPRPQARQISSQQVEVRSLDVYEQLTGVGA